jgi:hypothetical protein
MTLFPYTTLFRSKLQNQLKKRRKFIKPFLFVFILYLIASLPFIISDVYFIDDLHRSIIVDPSWNRDMRFIIELLFNIINFAPTINNIHPIPLLFGIGFVSVASLALVYIMCDRKIRYLPLLLSTFIGINPLITGVMIYKFDSIGMLFSLMMAILPFLLWRKLFQEKATIKAHIRTLIVITVCLMMVYLSYGHTTGAFLIMLMWMVVEAIIAKKPLKRLGKVAGLYLGSFIIATGTYFGLYKILPMVRSDITMPKISVDYLTTTFSGHFSAIVEVFTVDQKRWGGVLLLGLVAFGVALFCARSKNKQRVIIGVRNIVLGLVFVLVSLYVYQGVFSIFLYNNGRYAISIGVILAIIGITVARGNNLVINRIGVLPLIILLWVFGVFNVGFNNAINAQQSYAQSRITTLRSELLARYPDYKASDYKVIVQVAHFSYLSPAAKAFATHYPIVLNNIYFEHAFTWVDAFGDGQISVVNPIGHVFGESCNNNLQVNNLEFAIFDDLDDRLDKKLICIYLKP